MTQEHKHTSEEYERCSECKAKVRGMDKAREVAERLIRKIVLEAFQIAESRNTILLDDEDGAIEDPAEDAINVMVGDDFGCLDPDDKEDAQKIARFMNECTDILAAYAASERSRLAEKAEQEAQKAKGKPCKG